MPAHPGPGSAHGIGTAWRRSRPINRQESVKKNPLPVACCRLGTSVSAQPGQPPIFIAWGGKLARLARQRFAREATMNVKTPALAAPTAFVVALALLAGPAQADGMARGKAAPPRRPPQERCKLSANIGLATEYVFRGISQTSEGAAVQGGFDATCGMFYAGVWASNLDWGANDGRSVANIEMDWYGGVKFNTGRIAWDLGVIYYT